MNLRSQARALLIQAATLVRADKVAFHLQQSHPSQRAVVIAMHETPPALEGRFREQLETASRHFTITSLEGFATLWSQPQQNEASTKPLLLFTFDDGRESNYSVAAPLLESFGGRGIFFIVPTFAECADENQARSFYRTRMNPQSQLGEKNADWKPMSPAQIADLAARGHAIGNHTLTHQRLVGLSPETLEQEIGESACKLASWTKKPVDAFAWTFGWNEIDANAWQTIRRYHRFCFSPCAGVVDSRHDQPFLLWRREVEPRYSAPELRFSYSGLVDLWWASRRKRLRQMLQAPTP